MPNPTYNPTVSNYARTNTPAISDLFDLFNFWRRRPKRSHTWRLRFGRARGEIGDFIVLTSENAGWLLSLCAHLCARGFAVYGPQQATEGTLPANATGVTCSTQSNRI